MTLDFKIIASPEHGGYKVLYGTGHEQSATPQEVVMWELLKQREEEIEVLSERNGDLELELHEIRKHWTTSDIPTGRHSPYPAFRGA